MNWEDYQTVLSSRSLEHGRQTASHHKNIWHKGVGVFQMEYKATDNRLTETRTHPPAEKTAAPAQFHWHVIMDESQRHMNPDQQGTGRDERWFGSVSQRVSQTRSEAGTSLLGWSEHDALIGADCSWGLVPLAEPQAPSSGDSRLSGLGQN